MTNDYKRDLVTELKVELSKSDREVPWWVKSYLRECMDEIVNRRERIDELEARLTGGAGLIAAERQRQVSQEGWTPEHDDGHRSGELPKAAAALCMQWDDLWGLYARHRHDRQRQLVIAGALIAAELDRRARTAPKEGT